MRSYMQFKKSFRMKQHIKQMAEHIYVGTDKQISKKRLRVCMFSMFKH